MTRRPSAWRSMAPTSCQRCTSTPSCGAPPARPLRAARRKLRSARGCSCVSCLCVEGAKRARPRQRGGGARQPYGPCPPFPQPCILPPSRSPPPSPQFCPPPHPPPSFLGYLWNPLSWAMEVAALLAIILLDAADFALVGGRAGSERETRRGAVGAGRARGVWRARACCTRRTQGMRAGPVPSSSVWPTPEPAPRQIVALLLLNATISFVEESNADKAIKALAGALAPRCKVRSRAPGGLGVAEGSGGEAPRIARAITGALGGSRGSGAGAWRALAACQPAAPTAWAARRPSPPRPAGAAERQGHQHGRGQHRAGCGGQGGQSRGRSLRGQRAAAGVPCRLARAPSACTSWGRCSIPWRFFPPPRARALVSLSPRLLKVTSWW